MLELEFEPSNLPPTHTMHLLSSANIQGALLWGKSAVTHTLEGKFVKPATKVRRRRPMELAQFLCQITLDIQQFWIIHCETCGLRFLTQVEEELMLGHESALDTKSSAAVSECCILRCSLGEEICASETVSWATLGTGKDVDANCQSMDWITVLASEKPSQRKQSQESNPKPFKSNLSLFPVPF